MSSSPRVQRKLSNYLLDAHFQIKFTAYLVAAALAITVLLGGFLWRSSLILMRQTHAAVDARSRAAETSRELGNVALSSTILEHVNDPTFSAELQRRSRGIDQQYEVERAAIEGQRAELERQQRWTWVGLIAALGGFIVFIALAGIVTTHRIAGPIYRMKRIAAEVGDGKLVVPDRTLRRGDELQDLLDAMARMIERLRSLQHADLESLEKITADVERSGQVAVAAELRVLEARLRDRLARPAV